MKQKELQFKIVGAIEQQNVKLLLSLIDEGVDVNAVILYAKTPLTYALELGHSDIACRLIQAGCDVEKPMTTVLRPRPIHLAALRCCNIALKTLLHHSADVNSLDGGMSSALHYGAYFGFKDIVSVLLENKCTIDIKDDCGRTPVHRATEKSHFDIAWMLIKRGACLDVQDNYGWPPIFHTVIFNDMPGSKFLLENNCKLDLHDRNGNTVLHLACDRSSPKSVDILVRTSIDVQKRNKKIPTSEVIDLLHRGLKPNPDMLKRLVNSGARVNAKNNMHESPLYLLAFNQNLPLAMFMFLAGGRMDLLWLQMYSVLPSTAGFKDAYLENLKSVYERQISLAHECRNVIRTALASTRDISASVDALPIPSKLRQFLKECDNEI